MPTSNIHIHNGTVTHIANTITGINQLVYYATECRVEQILTDAQATNIIASLTMMQDYISSLRSVFINNDLLNLRGN